MDELIGKSFGRYQIIAELGRGGMAVVYRAYQPALGRHVALKVLPPYLAIQPSLVERFLREARTAARVEHPNIVPVYDAGQEGDVLYIAMRLIEGTSLKSLIRERGVLPLADSVRVTVQVSRALDYAHRRGVIHRDIKSSNIIVSQDGTALLMDFGIARVVTESGLTQTGRPVGTPEYMSPEQVEGKEAGAPSDIYSLGVVLYEAITGHVPFSAETPYAVLLAQLQKAPPAIASLCPGVSGALEAVVFRALEKNPEARFASAGDLAAALIEAATSVAPSQLASAGVAPVLRSPGAGAWTPTPPPPSSVLPLSDYRTPPPRPVTSSSGDAPAGMASAYQTIVPPVAPEVRGVGRNWLVGGAALAGVGALGALVLVGSLIAALVWNSSGGSVSDNGTSVSGAATLPAAVTSSSDAAEMVLVPAGEFWMGAEGRASDEAPRHREAVPAFYIDKYEVTNARYRRFLDANRAYPAPPDWQNRALPAEKANFPVANVSYADAQAYASWAAKRLPTEAQWEKAARGPDGRQWPWGNQAQKDFANTSEAGRKTSVLVGSFTRGLSPYGALDMIGNVWELTADSAYLPYPGGKDNGQFGGQYRVLRGGSWNVPQSQAWATVRLPVKPEHRNDQTGFRTVFVP